MGLRDFLKRMTATDDKSLDELAKQYREDDEESLKRNMYDWVTRGDREVRSSHAVMNWLRCRRDDPTVCSYDGGTTWVPRPKGATLSHPGDEDGCRCEAHPYRIENRIELKIKK
jgi:uncharacterized protein with gpF-like domain